MIDEELENAQCYAEKYVEAKSNNDSKWQSRFKNMSEEELNHAMMLHEYTVEKIEKINAVYKPKEEMLKKWNEAHETYVEKYAWIKQMLVM